MQIRDGPKSRFIKPSNLIDGTSISFTDGIGIKRIVPDDLVIELTNGREIQYDKLIIADDLETNFNKVPGLLEGLNNPYHPSALNFILFLSFHSGF